ncbi:MAG: hypothetical protein F4198_06460 [Acidobacteria bacterium]|nr:hypothetical protein [Acidobacteriota bacterium]
MEERQFAVAHALFFGFARLGQDRVAERRAHRLRRRGAEFVPEFQFPDGTGGLRLDLRLSCVERNLLEDPVDQRPEPDPGRALRVPRQSFDNRSHDVHLPGVHRVDGGIQRGERGGRDCPAGRDPPGIDGLPLPGEEGGFGCLSVARSVAGRIRLEQVP